MRIHSISLQRYNSVGTLVQVSHCNYFLFIAAKVANIQKIEAVFYVFSV